VKSLRTVITGTKRAVKRVMSVSLIKLVGSIMPNWKAGDEWMSRWFQVLKDTRGELMCEE
jgi:hypothetical protein